MYGCGTQAEHHLYAGSLPERIGQAQHAAARGQLMHAGADRASSLDPQYGEHGTQQLDPVGARPGLSVAAMLEIGHGRVCARDVVSVRLKLTVMKVCISTISPFRWYGLKRHALTASKADRPNTSGP